MNFMIIEQIKDAFSVCPYLVNLDNRCCAPLFAILNMRLSSLYTGNDLYKGKFDSSILDNLVDQSYSYVIKSVLHRVLEYEFELSKKYNLVSEDNKMKSYSNSSEMILLTNDIDWWSYILKKYNALDSMLTRTTDNIVSYIDFVLTSYCQDINIFKKTDIGQSKLESIQLFIGDMHHDRCVTAFVFKNEKIWYLKPRNTTNEIFLLYFIDILNRYGADIKLYLPEFIDCRMHSWHKHVDYKPLMRDQYVQDYYYNLGKVLCVFYLLHSQDIIPDNVISSSGKLYIIDFECLFSRYNNSSTNAVDTAYMNSVIGTGILPTWMLSGINSRDSISSVLFPFSNNDKHLPFCESKKLSITPDLMPFFIDGFVLAYKTVLLNSDKIVSNLEHFKFVDNRFILRIIIHPTSLYTLLANEALTPENLSDFEQLNDVVKELNVDNVPDSLKSAVLNTIFESLKEATIPSFYIKSDEKGLFDSFGNNIGNSFDFSFQQGTLNLVNKIKELSYYDLYFQKSIIEDSIKAFLHASSYYTHKKIELIECNHKKRDLLQAATCIAEKISWRVFHLNGVTNLVCKTRSQIDGRYQVLPLSSNLYDGYGGIIVFFETLYNYTSVPKYDEISRGLYESLIDYSKEYITNNNKIVLNLSAMTGIMGTLYVMELFPSKYYDKKLYDSIIQFVIDNLNNVQTYDFLTGVVGVLGFVLNAIHANSIKRNEIINRCISILDLTKQEKDDGSVYWSYEDGYGEYRRTLELGGFAHGSSSVCSMLFLAYGYTGSIIALDLAEKSLKHDRSFYSPKIKGWIDGRDLEHCYDGGSWCHGSSGVALSRLLIREFIPKDETILYELEIAFEQMSKVMGHNISICHGMGGNLEVMKVIAEETGDKNKLDFVEKWLFTIVDRVLQDDVLCCGDGSDRDLLGLFMGLSGLGYQFLRFYDWRNVPSILFLETKANVANFHNIAETEKHIE